MIRNLIARLFGARPLDLGPFQIRRHPSAESRRREAHKRETTRLEHEREQRRRAMEKFGIGEPS